MARAPASRSVSWKRVARGLRQVLVHDRVVDDGGGPRPGLPKLTGKPVGDVRRVDRGGNASRQLDRAAEPPETSLLVGPDRRQECEAAIFGRGVHGPAVAAAPFRDRQAGGQTGGSVSPEALEVDGAVLRPQGHAAAAEAEMVETEVQARARTDLEEAQRMAARCGLAEPEGEGGGAADLVGLTRPRDEGPEGSGLVDHQVAQSGEGRLGIDGRRRRPSFRGVAWNGPGGRQERGELGGPPFEGESVGGREQPQGEGIATGAGCCLRPRAA